MKRQVNPWAELQARQRAQIVEALTSGPHESHEIAALLCVGWERARHILGALRKEGIAGLVRMAGDRRVWVLSHQAGPLQAEQNRLMREAELDYQRRVRPEKRAKAQGIDLEDLSRDDWPVQQRRVSEWAPIRPAAPVSIFTLAAA